MSVLTIVIGAIVMLAGLSLFSALLAWIGGRDEPGDTPRNRQHGTG